MTGLPEQFLKRMRERLGSDFPAFLTSYELPPLKGLRVNPLKISVEEFRQIAPFALGDGVPWEQNGVYIQEEKPGADPYHFAGLYYLQEPSAMCAVPMLAVRPGERVLDLCAAPGGKTTQIAGAMQGEGVLIANEIDYDRAKILSQNVERLGITNCAVTSANPKKLAEHLPEYFDKILIDAPCSGEGMFKKEPNAIPEWSEENVRRCAARQREILDCAAQMLAGGGKMVYSTCTFASEEDEDQVGEFLLRHPEFELVAMKKLLPHEIRGEGHFVALLQKREGEKNSCKEIKTVQSRAVKEFAEEFLEEECELRLYETLSASDAKAKYYRYSSVPNGMPVLPVTTLRIGVELGEWDGKLFKPSHALAMAYGRAARRKVKLSREESIKYLHGETLETELENGWCVVCVEDYPIGLGKIVNGVVKNHLPKGLRMIK